MDISQKEHASPTGHRNTDPLVQWLSEAFTDLEILGQVVVDHYWYLLREGRKGRKYQDMGGIGLRLRRRTNGSFSMEWYHMGYLGKTKKSVEGAYIRKGRSPGYSVETFLRKEPEWLKEIVREVESVLMVIRERQAILIQLRSKSASYVRTLEGNKTYGSDLLKTFRSQLGIQS